MNYYISLAKEAVETFVKERRMISPSKELPESFLKEKSGVFVTIKKGKELKGCIGTYLPTKDNLAEEIISNAIAAATLDYRFSPIQKEELPYLSYTVYILKEPEKIEGPDQLNPKTYGVIVKTFPQKERKESILNNRSIAKTGLLLPDLEGVDSPEKQITIACKKAGINPLKEKITLYRFEVKRHQ